MFPVVTIPDRLRANRVNSRIRLALAKRLFPGFFHMF